MNSPAHSVVHLSIRRDKIKLAVGTGVLYQKDNETYIVTAWHNISGRHTETLGLLSKELAIPNNIIASIDVQVKQGESVSFIRMSITIPLLIENKRTTYFIHSQGYPKVDVVAIPIDLDKEYIMESSIASGEKVDLPIQLRSKQPHGLTMDIIHIQDTEFKNYDIGDYSDALYVSDEVFIIGYPKGITDYTGQAIWKRATIATSPHLRWQQQEQFLVDCASKEGMSGAPVIYYCRDGKINTGNIYYKGSEPISIFHGIYVGRVGSTSEFEAQVGKVWKRKIIDEIIDNKMYDFLPEELVLLSSDIKKIIEEEWPTENQEYTKQVLDEKTSYKYMFMHSIMEKINGRANKDDVLALILEYAETLNKVVKI
ncbi:MAG: Unknown protein [uncultured Sulfurovum sp.]|uniref:Serine protease n=1 Tax=uncultured Sulfurovum sp. TaxID=269237 RepID=A0A6S6SQ01_9BACT|nr:MAG: Unknown protein [uncultured Sulfurovum sp.]